MRVVYAGASVIFANSKNTRRMLLDLGVDAERVDIVYPGVDTERFRPDIDASEIRRHVAPHGETVLLSVGRFQARKGHDLVIQAVRTLTRWGYRSLRYVIVGDGQERSRLEALVDQCGVREFVTFRGEVSAELLPKYYAACDIFVLPNRIEQTDVEGFGIVFLEAAASGKPAIGGTTGGVPEAVANDVSGLLVNGTDVEELASTIARLMDDEPLRRNLGAAGRARAVRDFRWDCAAQRVGMAHRRNGVARSAALDIIAAAGARERKVS
jgi:phosphatidylinositol alpha-1,6-mannosyltransferase